ncbi:MAG: peptidoglycan-binding protein [Clostridia bacterium]|nr:peptidoglycan-binding protein [Clostridia bacterium]
MIDQRKAIENLQLYLREISYYDTNIPPTPIDGIYENATREAVKAFQREYGFTPNGIVDKRTWDRIYRVYKKYRAEYSSPVGIYPYPHMTPDFRVLEGEESDLVMMIQIMLNTIRLGFDDLGDFTVNGIHDSASVFAIKAVQRRSFLPQTGTVDAHTWNALASLYNKYIKIN